MCIGAVESLLFVYLQRDLLASTTLCGVSVAVSVTDDLCERGDDGSNRTMSDDAMAECKSVRLEAG